jgi:MFS family permease
MAKTDDIHENNAVVDQSKTNIAVPKHATENSGDEQRSWKFWLVFLSLCLLSFASALEGSIITTALPTISQSLSTDASSNYVWIANAFTLAQTVIQPPTAQVCNIFGRRKPLLVAIALFALGSGVAGGAYNVAMLITGRTIQGFGSGGIYMLVDLIVYDLVPLRDRGKYLGIVLSTAAVGAILGPVLGGALAEASWRWAFYINVPISGVVLIIALLFLRITYKESSWAQIFLKIDWIGNTLFLASITAILLGLTSGGVSALGIVPCHSTFGRGVRWLDRLSRFRGIGLVLRAFSSCEIVLQSHIACWLRASFRWCGSSTVDHLFPSNILSRSSLNIATHFWY